MKSMYLLNGLTSDTLLTSFTVSAASPGLAPLARDPNCRRNKKPLVPSREWPERVERESTNLGTGNV